MRTRRVAKLQEAEGGRAGAAAEMAKQVAALAERERALERERAAFDARQQQLESEIAAREHTAREREEAGAQRERAAREAAADVEREHNRLVAQTESLRAAERALAQSEQELAPAA